jgi:hypothetical protein
MISIIFSFIIPLYSHFNYVSAQQIPRENTSTPPLSLLNSLIVIDPHPKLIDNKNGGLINDINLAY